MLLQRCKDSVLFFQGMEAPTLRLCAAECTGHIGTSKANHGKIYEVMYGAQSLSA